MQQAEHAMQNLKESGSVKGPAGVQSTEMDEVEIESIEWFLSIPLLEMIQLR